VREEKHLSLIGVVNAQMVLKSRIFNYTLRGGIEGQEEQLNRLLNRIHRDNLVKVHMTNNFHIVVVYDEPADDLIEKYSKEIDRNSDQRNVGFEST
jgi:hypothetical protein